VFFYRNRDSIVGALDPLVSRFTSRPHHALDWNTNAPSTVIWLEYFDPSHALGPLGISPQKYLQGTLTDAQGRVATVKPLNRSVREPHTGRAVTGWVLPGDLISHHRARLQITSTNGAEVITIQVR
jgi:hypothetical protein